MKSKIDVFAITMALMIGTAGLPHVIVRFFTVPKVDARKSAGYALLFIALLYTALLSAFARLNFVDTVHNTNTPRSQAGSKLGGHRPDRLARQK